MNSEEDSHDSRFNENHSLGAYKVRSSTPTIVKHVGRRGTTFPRANTRHRRVINNEAEEAVQDKLNPTYTSVCKRHDLYMQPSTRRVCKIIYEGYKYCKRAA